MSRKCENLMLIEDGRALITCVHEGEIVREFETCRLHDGKHVRIDNGTSYPQLCAGASLWGSTLIYGASPSRTADEQLARDCDARLYRTRQGYDAARARLKPWEIEYFCYD